MKFTKLVPELYYSDIKSGLKTFVDCLEFQVGHEELNSDNPYCVLNKDGLTVLLFQNKEYSQQFKPLLRLVTDDIEKVYNRVVTNFSELLHPNLNTITMRPWGAKEFALLDDQIGIVIQKW